VLCSRVPLYQPMYSTMARRAAARVGQGRRSISSPLREAKKLSASALSQHWPSRMSAYRVLVRHGLIEPGPRKRPKDSYLRWERDEPMALWQLDIVGGMFLADGTEAKVVTGVDDHSRYCGIASVVARATGRAVCLAFASALRESGVPDEVPTDIQRQAVH
jgi:transposase InsO family protein